VELGKFRQELDKFLSTSRSTLQMTASFPACYFKRRLPPRLLMKTCTTYILYPPYPIYRPCPFCCPKFHHRNDRRTSCPHHT